MLLGKVLRLLGGCVLFCGMAFSQCYDLASTHLYEPKGEFHEWWDKPIWDAKPADGNFRVDEKSFGAFEEFAIFSIGVVKKTTNGWVPYRAQRSPEIWVDPTPKRSGSLRFVLPYQKPPQTAVYRVTSDVESEKWSVDVSGLVRYDQVTEGPERILEVKEHNAPPVDDMPGYRSHNKTVAVLNLDTGDYTFEMHNAADGAYRRRIPAGVHLERIETFHAKAKLKEVSCPASIRRVALSEGAKPEVTEMKAPAACVVKIQAEVDPKTGKDWEFLQNPANASSPAGCIQVFDQGAK